MTFRIAVVQPITHAPGNDEANVAEAVRHVERAADQGADFVCFPETYPGPWRMPATFDPTPTLAEAAVKHGVHVVFGTIEPIDAKVATAHNLIMMAYPDGSAPARYRRTHPNGPWIYTGGPSWEFQYVAGDAFPVFDTRHGKVIPCREGEAWFVDEFGGFGKLRLFEAHTSQLAGLFDTNPHRNRQRNRAIS